MSKWTIITCFMFVAEFTIVIFFYTLFLHLRVSVSITDTNNSTIETTKLLIWIILAITIGYGSSNIVTANVSALFADLYIRVNYVAFNDLAFFASTIMRTNFIVHFIVGLILLFLTIFLFFTTNIYYFMNITRRDSAKLAASKLTTQRGYYEQTAEEVQKIISNSREGL